MGIGVTVVCTLLVYDRFLADGGHGSRTYRGDNWIPNTTAERADDSTRLGLKAGEYRCLCIHGRSRDLRCSGSRSRTFLRGCCALALARGGRSRACGTSDLLHSSTLSDGDGDCARILRSTEGLSRWVGVERGQQGVNTAGAY